MATINKTFSVKNGIDVANTIVLDSNRNLMNVNLAIQTANITGVANISIVESPSLTNAYNQANSARDQANTARVTANDAYGQANTARNTANGAYGQANGSYAQANAAANTVAVFANGGLILTKSNLNFNNTATVNVLATANGTGQANISFLVNTASFLGSTGGTISGDLNVTGNLSVLGNTTTINVASLNVTDPILFLAANNGTSDVVDIGFVGKYNQSGVKHTGLIRNAGDDIYYLFDNYTPDPTNNDIDVAATTYAVLRANIEAQNVLINGQAAATTSQVGASNDIANAAYNQANSARNQANTAYGQANVAYDQANTARTTANNAYGTANLAYGQANVAYDQANTARTTANNAYGTANLAYGQANTARTTANDAYNTANTKVAKAGDTMTGALVITTAGTGLTVANANVTSFLTVGTLNVTTNTVTTASSGQVVLDTFALTALASAKYFIQANSGTSYHTTEMIVVQNGTDIYLTEYGTIQTGASLGTFTADISGGSARLLFTAVNNINTIRAARYGLIP